MNTGANVSVMRRGALLTTAGLRALGRQEIELHLTEVSLIEEGESLLQCLADYVRSGERKLHDGETVSYGYWLLKVQATADGSLELFERRPNGDGYVRGATFTLRCWRDQRRVCAQVDAEFKPPRPDALVAVAEGVLEGDPVDGVRYEAPAHMSGWWLFTARYKGDTRTIKTEHLYHITAGRPDLTSFLALPPGFRFSQQAGDRVWFDPVVAAEPAE